MKTQKRRRVTFVYRGCDISGTELFFRPIMKIDSCVAFYIISLVVNICIECFIIALMNTDASLLGVTQEAH